MKITLSVQDFGPHPRHHQTVLTPGIIRRSSPPASSDGPHPRHHQRKKCGYQRNRKIDLKFVDGSGPNLGGVKKKVDVGFTFIEKKYKIR